MSGHFHLSLWGTLRPHVPNVRCSVFEGRAMNLDRTQLRWNGWGWAARKDDFAGRDDVWAQVAAELGIER